jgi:hypothetical protein
MRVPDKFPDGCTFHESEPGRLFVRSPVAPGGGWLILNNGELVPSGPPRAEPASLTEAKWRKLAAEEAAE